MWDPLEDSENPVLLLWRVVGRRPLRREAVAIPPAWCDASRVELGLQQRGRRGKRTGDGAKKYIVCVQRRTSKVDCVPTGRQSGEKRDALHHLLASVINE